MTPENLISILKRHGFREARLVSGDEVRIRCPFHPDKNPSLDINPAKGVWLCRGCGRKGILEGLLKDIGIDRVRVYSIKSIDRRENRMIIEDIKEIYEHSIDLSKVDKLPKMLEQRQVTLDIVKRFGLRLCLNYISKRGFDWSGYVLFPHFNYKGEMEWMHGRKLSLVEKVFKSPSGFANPGVFFGEHLFKENEPVFLVEGAFDVFAIYKLGGVAFGIGTKSISNALIRKLVSLSPKKVIVCLDSDALKEAVALKSRLKFLGIDVEVLRMEGKDPDQMTEDDRERVLDLIRS